MNHPPYPLLNHVTHGQIKYALYTSDATPFKDRLIRTGSSDEAKGYEKAHKFYQGVKHKESKIYDLEMEQGNAMTSFWYSYWLDWFTWFARLPEPFGKAKQA